MLASAVSFADLRAYAAHPPAQGTSSSPAFRAIRSAAVGFRAMEPPPRNDDVSDDVAAVVRNMCSVISQRSGTQGRLCSNGHGCSNHRAEQREQLRAAVFDPSPPDGAEEDWRTAGAPAELGGGDGELAAAMLLPPPREEEEEGTGAPMFASQPGGDSDGDEALLLPPGAGGGGLMDTQHLLHAGW